MSEVSIQIVDKDKQVRSKRGGEREVHLCYEGSYQAGDTIKVLIGQKEQFYWLQLDDAVGRALVYLTGDIEYTIPFEERRTNLSPKAFLGNRHYLFLKEAKDFEIQGYRNLALNVCDYHGNETCFPHAAANVETRGEAVFAAKNAIDGVTMNSSHGEWPYESWGINMQDDAKIRIDFGREVTVNQIILYTRADFPHDNWWVKVSFTFSDGSSIDMALEKSCEPHSIKFKEKQIRFVEMHDMIKADAPSPFPALTQIEVYGKG